MFKYLLFLVCLFLSALLFNLFQYPYHLVTGGVGGLAIIVDKYFGIEPSIIIFIFSFGLLVIDYLFLGFKKTSGALISTFIYPIFIRITSSYNFIITNNMFLICIIVGVFGGLIISIIYKLGFNIGGFSALSEIISKFFNIHISVCTFIINFIIIVFAGIDMIFYSTFTLILNSLIIKLILREKTY